MNPKLKTILKWGLRLLLVVVVLAVIFFLSLDSIIRVIIERNIRAQTGMKIAIGKFHLGLIEPVVEIKNLQLYNSKEFGGAPFLNIPEIHVEYDRDALARNEIHITLLRFNLGELDVVKNQNGQTNIFSFGEPVPVAKKGAPANNTPSLAEIRKQTGMDFKGIDRLNVSVGDFKYVDLQNQSNNLDQPIGINNLVFTNITSAADLTGLGLLVGLRSGEFFKTLVAPDDPNAKDPSSGILNLLGH